MRPVASGGSAGVSNGSVQQQILQIEAVKSAQSKKPQMEAAQSLKPKMEAAQSLKPKIEAAQSKEPQGEAGDGGNAGESGLPANKHDDSLYFSACDDSIVEC